MLDQSEQWLREEEQFRSDEDTSKWLVGEEQSRVEELTRRLWVIFISVGYITYILFASYFDNSVANPLMYPIWVCEDWKHMTARRVMINAERERIKHLNIDLYVEAQLRQEKARQSILSMVARIRSRVFEDFQLATEVASKPTIVRVGDSEYQREVHKDSAELQRGSAVFYSTQYSVAPFLVFIYKPGYIIEYQLVSPGDQQIMTELFLRLSQAVLRAHKKNIALGSYLNTAYIKWELSNTGGLPTVRFDLPFRTPPDPAPPPNYPVPECPPEATMTSDIYRTPYVLAELLAQVKQVEAVVGQHAPQEGDHTFVYHPSPGCMPETTTDLQSITNNPLVSDIVAKCLSPDPSRRPTARILCDQLLRVCRRVIFAGIATDILKASVSMLKRLVI